ncbi:hypothetical protein LSH36_143g00009 [Paralvinella palmiformis]|uniref:Uncharacterized protein n=1 Tax=Paralvinella palmiformis TaxID=53620 RepID=A0AAD9JXC6_9ANNE|nr:hypothetical protein LSH36_143g00009 [Paralvinella palmiformis]
MILHGSGCHLWTSISWIFSVFNGTLIPILAMVLGVVHRDSCPLEPRITLYLYVTSSLCIGCFIYSITSACCLQRLDCVCFTRCNQNKCFYTLLLIEIAFNLTIFVWLIVGSVWIYSHHAILRRDNPRCITTFYLLSFILITVQWILFSMQHLITFIHTLSIRHSSNNRDQHKKISNYVSVQNGEEKSFDV